MKHKWIAVLSCVALGAFGTACGDDDDDDDPDNTVRVTVPSGSSSTDFTATTAGG